MVFLLRKYSRPWIWPFIIILFFICFSGTAYARDTSTNIQTRALSLESGESYSLSGTWSFQWGINGNENAPLKNWSTVEVPENWIHYNRPIMGYAWYALDLTLNPSSTPLNPGLLVSGIQRSYQLYINGILVHERGVETRKNAEIINPIKREVIPVGHFTGNEPVHLHLLIRISSFDGSGGGIVEAIHIGDFRTLTRYNSIRLFLFSFLSGAFMLLGLAQFIYYVVRPRAYYLLFFSLFSVTIGFHIILEDDLYLLFFQNGRLYPLWSTIWQANRVLMSYFLLEFLFHFLKIPGALYQWILRIAVYIVILHTLSDSSAFPRPTTVNLHNYFMFFILVHIPAAIVYRLIVGFRLFYIFSILGSLIFLASFLVGVLSNINLFPRLLLLAGGFSIMAILFAFSMAIHYATALQQLEDLNFNLDQRIKNQTQDLETALEHLNSDLQIAQKFQQILLPVLDRTILRTGFQYLPYQMVSGDILDISIIDEKKERFFIADATGHGIHASLATMVIRLFYDQLKRQTDMPHELLQKLRHSIINEYPDLNIHFTAFVMDLDRKSGGIRYSSAGHPAQYKIIRDPDNQWTAIPLKTRGTFISRHFDKGFVTDGFKLEFDERIVLFTDGLLDVRNTEGELFDETILIEYIKRTMELSPVEQSRAIIQMIRDYTNNNGFEDDATLLICQQTTI